MDFAVIEPALAAWASALTGVEATCVLWENAPRVQHNGRIVLLSWVSSVGRGVDGVAWEYAAHADPLQEMTPVSRGPRELVVQLSAQTHDQRPGQTARALLEQLRDRLHWPSGRAILSAAGLALGSMPGSVTPADYRVDGRMVSRAVLDVRLNAVSNAADTAGRTGYLATVAVASALTDPAGDPLPASLQLGDTLP